MEGQVQQQQHNGLDPPPQKAPQKEKTVIPVWAYLYCAAASMMSFTYGFNSAIVASAMVFIPDMSMGEAAAIVSIMLFGAFLGSFAAGPLADLLGRKPVMLCNYAFVLVAALGSALVSASWQLVIWRFLVGVGAGVASVVPALYVTEVSPAAVRGMLSTGNQLAGSLGIVTAYFAGATIVACQTAQCWRWMFATGTLFAVTGFVATCFIPESPRWLLAIRKSREEALRVLEKVYGVLNEGELRVEYRRMCDQMNSTRHKDEEARWRDLGRRQYRKPLLISALFLPLLQGLSGNTTLVYYTVLLLTSLGLTRERAVLYAALSSLPQPLMLAIVFFIMDRVGRKLLLLISIAGTAVSTLTMGILLYFYRTTTDADAAQQGYFTNKALILTGIVMFRMFYAVGLGPVPQVLAPELLPFAVRARGTAISLGVYWLTVGIVSALFPPLLRLLPAYSIYACFTVLLVLGLFLAAWLVRETKRKSLEEIESMHCLPVLAPDGSNRDALPQESMIARLKPVTVLMPPSSPSSSSAAAV